VRVVHNLGAWRWRDGKTAGVCVGEKLDANDPGEIYISVEMAPEEMRALALDLLNTAAEMDR
jgi:hypothetical protein